MDYDGLKRGTAEIQTEEAIQDVLLSIGIPPNLLGYAYIIYGTELILSEPNYMRGITTHLYVDIAKKFNTKVSRVERDIRHAINVGWLYGSIEDINRYFKNCINPDKGVPTNALFFSRLYHILKNSIGVLRE